MTFRVKALLVCLTLAACAYLYATEPSAEGGTNTAPVEPSCPAGTQSNGTDPSSGGLECVCPGGLPVSLVNADGSAYETNPCLIPPTSVVGDPTEPEPFDDGDYPLVPPSPHAEPIAGDPAFTG